MVDLLTTALAIIVRLVFALVAVVALVTAVALVTVDIWCLPAARPVKPEGPTPPPAVPHTAPEEQRSATKKKRKRTGNCDITTTSANQKRLERVPIIYMSAC